MIRCSNITFLDELNQVCRADGMTYVIVWDNVRFHHAQNGASMVSGPTTINLPPCTYLHTLLSLTRLRNFSPHGGGRYMIGALTNQPPISMPWMRHAMTSRQTSVWPGFAQRFFPRSLANENIHCDVDENLWPNPQDRVEGNTEVQ